MERLSSSSESSVQERCPTAVKPFHESISLTAESARHAAMLIGLWVGGVSIENTIAESQGDMQRVSYLGGRYRLPEKETEQMAQDEAEQITQNF